MNTLKWIFPNDLLFKSIEIMRPHGEFGNEGLALWFGNSDNFTVKITHVVKLTGDGFATSPLFLQLSPRAMASLTDLTSKLGGYLVGQIHSHPELFTDLSELDIAKGIRINNYLSLVCPHYAQVPSTKLTDCGVHVFENGQYRRMSNEEALHRIHISNFISTSITCEVAA